MIYPQVELTYTFTAEKWLAWVNKIVKHSHKALSLLRFPSNISTLYPLSQYHFSLVVSKQWQAQSFKSCQARNIPGTASMHKNYPRRLQSGAKAQQPRRWSNRLTNLSTNPHPPSRWWWKLNFSDERIAPAWNGGTARLDRCCRQLYCCQRMSCTWLNSVVTWYSWAHPQISLGAPNVAGPAPGVVGRSGGKDVDRLIKTPA